MVGVVTKVVESQWFGVRIDGLDHLPEVLESENREDRSKDLLLHHLGSQVRIVNDRRFDVTIVDIESTTMDNLPN